MAMTRGMQPSFASGELAPSMYGRVDIAKFQSGLKTCTNFQIRPQGGAENRPGTIYVAKALGQGRLIPFSYNVEQSYFLEFTDYIMRIIKDGGLVLRPLSVAATYQWTASGAGTNEYYLEAAGGGDPSLLEPASGEVYESGSAMTGGTMGSLAASEWDYGDNDTLGFSTLYVRLSDGSDPDAGADYGVSCVARTTSPYAVADLSALKFTQSADTMFFAHKDYAPRTLTRTDHFEWSFSTISFTPTATAPTGLTSSSPGSGRTIYYKVAAVVDGEESLPTAASSSDVNSPWGSGHVVDISWNAVAGAEAYNVYKSSRGYYGWVGTVTGTSYSDDNVDPDVSDGPKEDYNPFDSNNHPGCVGLHEQRVVYAASDDDPQTVWASQTGKFENFSISRPLKDTDSIEVTIASRQVNEVRHLIPLDDLIVLTSGAEWVMSAGSSADALSPTSLNLKVQSYRGCSDVPPLVIGSTVLFVQRDGATVQDLGYSFASDAYESTNLTVLAAHLFEGKTISEWAYQQRPNSIIWCVMSDGTLLSFTYLKDQEVWAWAKHTTDGEFESVSSIPGLESYDEVSFIVKRTIDGTDYRYIESFAERMPDGDVVQAVFMDSALSYSGASTKTFTGLDHLEGEDVHILADGTIYKDKTVSSGSVTIDNAASTVHIGLAIPTPTIETLPLEIQGAAGRKRRVNRVTARLEASRGFWAGPDLNHMVESKWRSTEVYGEATSVFTGDKEILMQGLWDIDASIIVQQRDPLPLTISAIMPEIDVGG